MKHQKKSSREKYWTIIGIIALFVLAGLTYFVFFNSTYSSSDSSPPSDKPAESSGTKTPTNSSDEEETTNSAKNQKDADEPSNPDESVSIIAAYVNGSTFDIRTSIRSVTDICNTANTGTNIKSRTIDVCRYY